MHTQITIPEANKFCANQSIEAAARCLYNTAKRSNLLANLKKLFGKDNTFHLFTLDEVLRHLQIQGQKALGVITVDINQILGTMAEGRSRDFDIDFRPLQEHNRERWLGVAAAWISGCRLSPVKLVKVGDIFFVEDGHHRISVARAMGEQEIEAEVVMLLGTGTLAATAPVEQSNAAGRLVLQPAAN